MGNAISSYWPTGMRITLRFQHFHGCRTPNADPVVSYGSPDASADAVPRAVPIPSYSTSTLTNAHVDDPHSLRAALAVCIMVDAAWLAALADAGNIIPRCQDVPTDAIVTVTEMLAWNEEFTTGTLVIS